MLNVSFILLILRLKTVHFLSILNILIFQISFFFLEMDPCLLEQVFSVFSYSSALLFHQN